MAEAKTKPTQHSVKELRSIGLGTNAVSRLTVLAPEKVDQLPPPEPTSPFAGLGGLGGGAPMLGR